MQYALGIDIGGTHTKLGIVDAQGQVSLHWKFTTNATGDDPHDFLQRLEQHIRDVLSQFDREISGIGLSVHGHLDAKRQQQILGNSTPALRGINLFDFIRNRFHHEPIINNDLTAHALSEYYFGVGDGAKRFLCLALGTGIGAGVIVEGQPIRYIDGTAGDAGRIILDPNASPDNYGVSGSAEALCGVAGIERLAYEHYGKFVKAQDVISAARTGNDPIAQGIMQTVGRYLGRLLAILSPVLLPERIALTGGTTEAGSVLLQACQQEFDRLMGAYHNTLAQLSPAYYAPVSIVYGKMRGESGVVGSVVELFIDNIN